MLFRSHYDVTGKACPKYFVDNQDEWENFIYAIDQYMDKNSVEVTKEEWEGVYGEGETVVTPTEEASIEFSE